MHGLNIRALEEVRQTRLSMVSFLTKAKIAPSRAGVTDVTAVRKALAIAFFTHSAFNYTGDIYRTVHENTPALLSPQSSLIRGNYEWIVYTDLHISGGKQYFRLATAINPEWLVVSLSHNTMM